MAADRRYYQVNSAASVLVDKEFAHEKKDNVVEPYLAETTTSRRLRRRLLVEACIVAAGIAAAAVILLLLPL